MKKLRHKIRGINGHVFYQKNGIGLLKVCNDDTPIRPFKFSEDETSEILLCKTLFEEKNS